MKERFAELGYHTPFASSRAELTKFIAKDTEKWARVIRAANIKPECRQVAERPDTIH